MIISARSSVTFTKRSPLMRFALRTDHVPRNAARRGLRARLLCSTRGAAGIADSLLADLHDPQVRFRFHGGAHAGVFSVLRAGLRVLGAGSSGSSFGTSTGSTRLIF